MGTRILCARKWHGSCYKSGRPARVRPGVEEGKTCGGEKRVGLKLVPQVLVVLGKAFVRWGQGETRETVAQGNVMVQGACIHSRRGIVLRVQGHVPLMIVRERTYKRVTMAQGAESLTVPGLSGKNG